MTVSGYSIEPKMDCGEENGAMSFVVHIPVTADNRPHLFVDDPKVAEKVYVEKAGSRCPESTASAVTVKGQEELKIVAPIVDCGSKVRDGVALWTRIEKNTE